MAPGTALTPYCRPAINTNPAQSSSPTITITAIPAGSQDPSGAGVTSASGFSPEAVPDSSALAAAITGIAAMDS